MVSKQKKNPQEIVIDATLDNFRAIRENTLNVLDTGFTLRDRQKFLIQLLTEGRYFRNMKNDILDIFMSIPQLVEELRDIERKRLSDLQIKLSIDPLKNEIQDLTYQIQIKGDNIDLKILKKLQSEIRSKELEIEKIQFPEPPKDETDNINAKPLIRTSLIDELVNIWEQEAQQIIKECYPNLEEYTLNTLKAVAEMKFFMQPGQRSFSSDSIKMESDVNFQNI